MTQRERDRLVALKKAKNGLITQREAAAEIGQSERHIRRLLVELRAHGDAAIVHQLRERPSGQFLPICDRLGKRLSVAASDCDFPKSRLFDLNLIAQCFVVEK